MTGVQTCALPIWTGFNDGAVGFAASAIYSTDYVFRGLEIVEAVTNEDAANLGITAELAFDLGRLDRKSVV